MFDTLDYLLEKMQYFGFWTSVVNCGNCGLSNLSLKQKTFGLY